MIRGAVLGSPISHSLSPLLHQSAFASLNIEGEYQAIDVPSGSLNSFFDDQSNSFDYLSLTMPLKEEAFSLPVSFDELSTRIGSANTLYKVDGSWHGTSTDGSGFISALHSAGFANFTNALILGAGGTARAVAGALDGFSESITVMGRTSTRRDALSRCVRDSSFNYISWSNDQSMADFDCVINTTPAGAADLLADYLPSAIDALLFDVIYKPWPTVLAKKWSNLGAPVISGVELLLYQGIEQLRIVTDKNFDTEKLASNLREKLATAL
jgi:shikimate dehydrogenase